MRLCSARKEKSRKSKQLRKAYVAPPVVLAELGAQQLELSSVLPSVRELVRQLVALSVASLAGSVGA